MNKEEFLIYCLLYAVDAAGVKKQNLVQMSSKTDAIVFVKIYNMIQQQDEAIRKSLLDSMLKSFNKNEVIEDIKNTFLLDMEPSLQENIIEVINQNPSELLVDSAYFFADLRDACEMLFLMRYVHS